jgi:hypothetical protein
MFDLRCASQRTQVMEQMVMAAIHVFEVPDIDFIMHFGDGCPPDGVPMLCAWR